MPARQTMQPAFDYDVLTGEIQHTLAAIADAEFEFQSACERLEAAAEDQADKDRLLDQLEQVRRARRGLLEQRLMALQDQARRLTRCVTQREHAPAESPISTRAASLAIH